MPWPDDGEPTTTEQHLVERYAPGAPAAVKRSAAAMVRGALPTGADRAGSPSPPIDVSQTQDAGQAVSFRDTMRASAIMRSGAAGILAPWRQPRARKVSDDD